MIARKRAGRSAAYGSVVMSLRLNLVMRDADDWRVMQRLVDDTVTFMDGPEDDAKMRVAAKSDGFTGKLCQAIVRATVLTRVFASHERNARRG